MTALVKQDISKEHELSLIEQVVMQGDLSKLNPEQRVLYYRKVCDSAGLNPFTRPFDYISLNGKLTLYAKKDATEQLRKLNGISIERLECKVVEDLYIVKATAKTKDGRMDEATGAVVIGHLKGEAKANAIMKAETKAKRRVTLSISGMGWTDETEIDSIPNAKPIDVDLSTGEIKKESDKAEIYKIEVHPAAFEVRPEKKEVKKPTADEIKALNEILDQCDPEFVKDKLDKIKTIPGVQTLDDINVATYIRLLDLAHKNKTEYMLKMMGEEDAPETELHANNQ